MKKKGFTLIELLAVIVILAIIALIAVPIVLNMIEKSKESATIRGAEYYLNAVEQGIARAKLNNIKVEDGTYNILSNGNICKEDNGEVCLTIEVQGEKPTGGKITIGNGKISAVYKLTISDKKVSTNSKNELEIKEYQIYKITYENITETTNLIKEIEEGNTLKINLKDKGLSDSEIIVKINGTEIVGYTYANYELIVPEVTGEVLVIGKNNPTLVENLKNLFSQTKTATVNSKEYSLDETNGLMYDRFGGTTTSLTDGNLRYYGANPNNYIDIGDRDSSGNIIFWRIIGVFKDVTVVNDDETTSTQDLIKIIRADNLSDGNISTFIWNNYQSGSRYDKWDESILMEMLNHVDGYYGSGSSYTYKNSVLNLSSAGLSSNVRNKVSKVRWTLGGNSSGSVYANVLYDRDMQGTAWDGKIGLMYASDYGYATDLSQCSQTLAYNKFNTAGCYDTDWLFNGTNQWTITSYNQNAHIMFVTSSGYIGEYSSSSQVNSNYHGVRPVLYLNSNISIKETKTAIINGVETEYYVVE